MGLRQDQHQAQRSTDLRQGKKAGIALTFTRLQYRSFHHIQKRILASAVRGDPDPLYTNNKYLTIDLRNAEKEIPAAPKGTTRASRSLRVTTPLQDWVLTGSAAQAGVK